MTKAKCGYGFMQHWINNDLGYKESEGPIVIVYGMKWKCEGPPEATDIEITYTSQTGQGPVQVAQSSAFHRKMNDWT